MEEVRGKYSRKAIWMKWMSEKIKSDLKSDLILVEKDNEMCKKWKLKCGKRKIY